MGLLDSEKIAGKALLYPAAMDRASAIHRSPHPDLHTDSVSL